jgi:hypothetical protein
MTVEKVRCARNVATQNRLNCRRQRFDLNGDIDISARMNFPARHMTHGSQRVFQIGGPACQRHVEDIFGSGQ